jgi:5'-methylthioadenosine phosphorylase
MASSTVATVPQALVGIIGGSGLYKIDGLENTEEVLIETPFGLPSDKILLGTLEGVKVAFLARHGLSHSFTPSEVPYRANIYAMKKLGVKYILSASAVGSLQEEHRPLDIVLVDQFIDRTTKRTSTFFGEGIVAHVEFGDPICKNLKALFAEAIAELKLNDVRVATEGTYVTMEGPQFSTKAESKANRATGAAVIGMTNGTEAKLAREAEIAYASMCMVTDYDCWHPDHENVTVDMVIKTLHQNADNARAAIKATVKKIGINAPESKAHSALKFAIMTPLDKAPKATVHKLDALLKPYLPK